MKKTNIVNLMIVMPLLLVSFSASAAIIDQSQLTYDIGIPFEIPTSPGPNVSNIPTGQSFTAGITGLLTQIDIYANGQYLGMNDLTMEIRSGDGLGGTILGSLTQTVGPIPGGPGLSGIILNIDTTSLGVNVVSGSSYTFLFTNITGSGDLYTRGVLGSRVNPYSGGRSYNPTAYGDTVDWDYAFQTHVVPLPAAVWLFGSALIGLIGLKRRSSP